MTAAGDVNGDGFDDLIIGAAGRRPERHLSGASYVVFGKAAGFAANLDLSTLERQQRLQDQRQSRLTTAGFSVTAAGDVNGDGFDDLIVGAPAPIRNGAYSGASYVVFGKAARLCGQPRSLEPRRQQRLQAQRRGRNDYCGFSVASRGDVNGDGFDDLIVGAPSADMPNAAAIPGRATWSSAKRRGFAANLDLSELDGSNGFKLSGEGTNDHSGISVTAAGDVNGDGFGDLIVGASAPTHGSAPGRAMWSSARPRASPPIDLSSLDGSNGFKISGVAANDQSGCSVAAAGDVNGDGFGDVIVGASGRPNGDIRRRATWSSARRRASPRISTSRR